MQTSQIELSFHLSFCGTETERVIHLAIVHLWDAVIASAVGEGVVKVVLSIGVGIRLVVIHSTVGTEGDE